MMRGCEEGEGVFVVGDKRLERGVQWPSSTDPWKRSFSLLFSLLIETTKAMESVCTHHVISLFLDLGRKMA